MPITLDNKLVIAISSRALFDLDESNSVFDAQGLVAYREYQLAHEDEPLNPGVAFDLIQRLLQLDEEHQPVEVILVSKNDANTGLRIFNSVEHYGLPITRAAFTDGMPPYKYLAAFRSDLFLSANPVDVRQALDAGFASATILSGINSTDDNSEEVRIAFDGDAVLFSDEAEKVYAEHGLEAFKDNELHKAEVPLTPGPFQPFLMALNRIQQSGLQEDKRSIRTALVTARNAPSHKRAIKTLRAWGVDVDEAFFLGGLDKSEVLKAFRPHIFFDDQNTYCISASSVVPTGHVPYGVRNK